RGGSLQPVGRGVAAVQRIAVAVEGVLGRQLVLVVHAVDAEVVADALAIACDHRHSFADALGVLHPTSRLGPAPGHDDRSGAVTLEGAMNTTKTYDVRTHGCQMNVHDSERLAGLLETAGYVDLASV